MSLIKKLKGTGVAVVTPFKNDLSIDFDAIKKLVDFLINNGIKYIVYKEQQVRVPQCLMMKK